MYDVITISREFGSAGRTIGRMVAEKLGIPFYDEEIISKIAERTGFAHDYVDKYDEDVVSTSWFVNAMVARDMSGRSMQDKIWIAQCEVIKELANNGPCVIVGRCANYVLKDTKRCLSVFVHAPIKFRLHRIVEVYGERNGDPMKRVIDKDKTRRLYYETYTGLEWGNAKNYNIALNSSELGIDKCVDIICSACQSPITKVTGLDNQAYHCGDYID